MRAATMIFTGITALAAGAMVYVLDRPVGIFSFFEKGYAGVTFGPAGDWLPDALHPFAMALICAGTAGGKPKSLRFWAVFWGCVGLWMEAGQYYGERAASLLPPAFHSMPFLHRIGDYFIHGTFDPMDVMGIVLGSAAAFSLSFYKTPLKMPQKTRISAFNAPYGPYLKK